MYVHTVSVKIKAQIKPSLITLKKVYKFHLYLKIKILKQKLVFNSLIKTKITSILDKTYRHSCQIDKSSNRQILEEKNRQNRQGRLWIVKKIVTKIKSINMANKTWLNNFNKCL